MFFLAACSNTQQNDAPDPVSDEEPSQVVESTPADVTETEPPQTEDDTDVSNTELASSEPEGSNILIGYFTYGENAELSDDVNASATASIQIFNGEVTGNTGVMVHMISEASGGSAFSDAIDEINDMEPDATVLDGLHIGGSSVYDAESRVSEWVQELGLSK